MITINKDQLEEFERSIDTIHPERGPIPIKILGYGEISMVFEFLDGDNANHAFKRIPIFDTEEEVSRHSSAIKEYEQLLQEKMDIIVPNCDIAWVHPHNERPVALYCAQEKLPPESIGNQIIHDVDENNLRVLLRQIFEKLNHVWDFNSANEDIMVGIDGQVSNWSVKGYNKENPVISSHETLLYVDTTTPMFRVNGEEAMEALLFLKSAPGILRPFLNSMLDEVLDRYYVFRLVLNDLIANFYKEQEEALVPKVIEEVNMFLETDAAHHDIPKFTIKEIKDYYKRDKQIWIFFQNARRMDRFIRTKILRKHYPFYLPGKIKR